jgi:hypothetical protein
MATRIHFRRNVIKVARFFTSLCLVLLFYQTNNDRLRRVRVASSEKTSKTKPTY